MGLIFIITTVLLVWIWGPKNQDHEGWLTAPEAFVAAFLIVVFAFIAEAVFWVIIYAATGYLPEVLGDLSF